MDGVESLNSTVEDRVETGFEGTWRGNLKFRARIFAGRHELLWSCWRKFRGSPLPKASELDMILEGYPRSGNTYAEHMLRIMTPGLRWISHTHSRGTVFWAAKSSLPALVLVREPIESAASLYLYMQGSVSLSLCLERWKMFHEATLKHPAVSYLFFDELINDTENCLRKALGCFPGLVSRIERGLPDDYQQSFKETHDRDIRHLREVRGVDFGEHQQNRPSEKRSRMKGDVTRALNTAKYAGLTKECRDLYVRLESLAKS